MIRKTTLSLLLVTAVAVVVGFITGNIISNQTTEAAGGKVPDPKGTAKDRYVYYPGTEALGPDEIRLFACGTGMPLARLGQAAT